MAKSEFPLGEKNETTIILSVTERTNFANHKYSIFYICKGDFKIPAFNIFIFCILQKDLNIGKGINVSFCIKSPAC